MYHILFRTPLERFMCLSVITMVAQNTFIVCIFNFCFSVWFLSGKYSGAFLKKFRTRLPETILVNSLINFMNQNACNFLRRRTELFFLQRNPIQLSIYILLHPMQNANKTKTLCSMFVLETLLVVQLLNL
jgi:hypothetical protein